MQDTLPPPPAPEELQGLPTENESEASNPTVPDDQQTATDAAASPSSDEPSSPSAESAPTSSPEGEQQPDVTSLPAPDTAISAEA